MPQEEKPTQQKIKGKIAPNNIIYSKIENLYWFQQIPFQVFYIKLFSWRFFSLSLSLSLSLVVLQDHFDCIGKTDICPVYLLTEKLQEKPKTTDLDFFLETLVF